MPVLILKALECETTASYLGADDCRLEVSVDGGVPDVLEKSLNNRQRWILDRSFPFQGKVKINLTDTAWEDQFIGEFEVGPNLKHRVAEYLHENDSKYFLWYEVIDPALGHTLTDISLRQMLGRMGRGVLSRQQYQELIGRYSIYRCSEVISLRDIFQFHAQQDRGKGNTNSVRTWINRHCNPWGEDSVIPVHETPDGNRWYESGATGDQWEPVNDKKSYCLAGFQHYSRLTDTDYPLNHATMDWNWFQIPDPAFMYMLNYTAKRNTLDDGTQYPYIENEWEEGSMPIQWRPFWGEYVTTWGRNIFDVGHVPVAPEIHPAHTIVTEHTTAAPLGSGGAMVPANRAVIGMGLSGGFPGNIGSRWKDEFGQNPPVGIWLNAMNCWATNLKKHPLKFKLFPPVARPSSNAVLEYRIAHCAYIQVPDWGSLGEFLGLCKNNDPAEGGELLAFRRWRLGKLPSGFEPVVAPAALEPKLTLRENSYFDVEVDLAPATQIPVGYLVVIVCGWSEPGDHDIFQFDVTFKNVKAEETEESWDDWYLFYGVNGQWDAWWTDDAIEEGKTYSRNTTFHIATIDDMPISIRDTGIEYDGFDTFNEKLDRVEITAAGPNHFDEILDHKGVGLVTRTENTLEIKAKGWEMVEEDTKHEWTIKIDRREL